MDFDAAGDRIVPPIWPPPEATKGSDALKPQVPICPELDKWTSPDLTITAIKDVVCCADRVVLLLTGCAGPLRKSTLALWAPPSEQEAGHPPGAVEADLRPLELQAYPTAPGTATQIWPADDTGFLARCGGGIWRVELAGEDGHDAQHAGEALAVRAAQVFTLPPRLSGLACQWCSAPPSPLPARPGGSESGGFRGLVCAMLIPPEPSAASGPLIVGPGQSLHQLPASTLCLFDAAHGLRAVASAPRLSEGLSLSAGRRQVCVWKCLLNEVPEEAERGEFLAFDCSGASGADAGAGPAGSRAVCLTQGAGRVGASAVSEDGELILLQANFSRERPITTHMALVLLHWPTGAAEPLPERRMLVQGEHIVSFGFLPHLEGYAEDREDAHGPAGSRSFSFHVTRLAGVDPESSLWTASPSSSSSARLEDAEPSSVRLAAPVFSRLAGVLRDLQGAPGNGGRRRRRRLVFGTESVERLPELAAIQWPAAPAEAEPSALACFGLPQPEGAGSFGLEKVTFAHGGFQVAALLCERLDPPLPLDAPLLVHAHGGPAIGVVATRRLAADQVRYPYKHLLAAGYRIFQPLFRGTLGFGDRWAQGNIGSQGAVSGDLGDILAGLDWLQSSHPRLKGSIAPERTGIFGGSYGGYLTIRAMSAVPDRFAAGVAMYGYVHNRWMSYEGGDFTWEDEYIVPPPLEASGFCIELVEENDDSADPTRGRRPEREDVEQATGGVAGRAAARGGRAGDASCASPRGQSPAASMSSLPASDVWPLPPEMEASDTFNGLHHICKPMLVMHGEKDDICPLSQSQVVFHMLEKRGVPTGLIVYPGEGHGFDDPAHQRDRDRRVLVWFQEHISGNRGLQR